MIPRRAYIATFDGGVTHVSNSRRAIHWCWRCFWSSKQQKQGHTLGWSTSREHARKASKRWVAWLRRNQKKVKTSVEIVKVKRI